MSANKFFRSSYAVSGMVSSLSPKLGYVQRENARCLIVDRRTVRLAEFHAVVKDWPMLSVKLSLPLPRKKHRRRKSSLHSRPVPGSIKCYTNGSSIVFRRDCAGNIVLRVPPSAAEGSNERNGVL